MRLLCGRCEPRRAAQVEARPGRNRLGFPFAVLKESGDDPTLTVPIHLTRTDRTAGAQPGDNPDPRSRRSVTGIRHGPVDRRAMRSEESPVTMVRSRRFAGVAAVALLAGAGLTACGSSSGSTASATSATTSAAGQQGGPGGTQMAAIQKCLAAAGISMPTPSGVPGGQGGGGTAPSGAPSGMPSGAPSGTPPAGATGGPGAGGAGGGMFSDAKVVAALKACGLTAPTGRPQGSGTATPSATATS